MRDINRQSPSTRDNKNMARSPRMMPNSGISGIRNSNSNPTRMHLTPNSIPPSPPPVMMNVSPHMIQAPFVPNLGISIPSSPGRVSYGPAVLGIGATGINTPPPGTPRDDQVSPYMKVSKSVINSALANERERVQTLEEKESDPNITVKELRSALRKERQYSRGLVKDLASLKSIAVASTLEAEVNEEGRINCLMRKLDGVQKEKGRIIVELEREEEMLTNTLQKKLNEVRKEKAQLEKQIEREHMLKTKLEKVSSTPTEVSR